MTAEVPAYASRKTPIPDSRQEDNFLEMLDDQRHRIMRVCRAYAEHETAAQDLFQEVVLQLWRAENRYRGEASRTTWVYRIALNVCLRRRLKINRRDRERASLEGLAFDPPGADPVAPLEEAEIRERLYACIRKLPQAERALMVLFLEELPYREIGRILGMSENHVAVKVRRIKGKLYHCLQDSGYGR